MPVCTPDTLPLRQLCLLLEIVWAALCKYSFFLLRETQMYFEDIKKAQQYKQLFNQLRYHH